MKRLHNSLHKAGHASKGRAEVVALMSGDGEVIDLRSDSDEEVEVVAAPAVPVAAAARRAEKRTLAEPVALGGNKRGRPNQHGGSSIAPAIARAAAAASAAPARSAAPSRSNVNFASHFAPRPAARAPAHPPVALLPSQQPKPTMFEEMEAAMKEEKRGAAPPPQQGPRPRSRHNSRPSSRNPSRASSPIEPAGGGGGGAGGSSSSSNRAADQDCKQRLLRHVLSWQSSLLSRSRSSTPPPDGGDFEGARLPTAFVSAADYRARFKPLLLMELREDLVKSKEENRFPPVTVDWGANTPRHVQHHAAAAATPLDDDSDPLAQSGMAAWEITIGLEVDPKYDIHELDVLILYPPSGSRGGGNHNQPQHQQKQHMSWEDELIGLLPALAVVTRREREEHGASHRQLRLMFSVSSSALHSLRGGGGGKANASGGCSHRQLPKPDGSSSMRAQKIGQCTSSWREWFVLHRLDPSASRGVVRPELLEQLLSAVPSTALTAGGSSSAAGSSMRREILSGNPDDFPPDAPSSGRHWKRREKWDRLVNAVCGKDKNHRRLDKDQSAVLKKTSDLVFDAKIGFSLVQGPPGTGKTTLLRGLLNVLHNAATQAYYDAVLNVVNSVAAQEVRSSASAQHNKSEGPAGAAGLLAQIAQGVDSVSARQGHKPVRRGGILVCAQSNGAIDELVARLLRLQFVDEFDQRYHADFVRIGSQASEAVKPVSLKQRASVLASTAMGVSNEGSSSGGAVRSPSEQQAQKQRMSARRAQCDREQKERGKLRHQILTRQEDLGRKYQSSEGVPDATWPQDAEQLYGQLLGQDGHHASEIIRLQNEIDRLDSELRAMGCVESYIHTQSQSNPSSTQSSSSSSRSHQETSLGPREQRALEREVVDNAHIVFCTLSGAGEAARLAEVRGGFETVIFDEACQASELSTLIPLQFGAKRVILVGDPQQLPSTVISSEAKRRGYDISLFERLMRGGHIPMMLRTQYRMHPAIRAFPSLHFYDNKLKDGENVKKAAGAPAGSSEGPPGFLFVNSGSSRSGGGSSSSGGGGGEAGQPSRLAPYAFLSLRDSHQSYRSADSKSLRNEAEAKLVVRLLLGLVQNADHWQIELTVASETSRMLGAAISENDGSRARSPEPQQPSRAATPPVTSASSASSSFPYADPFGGLSGRCVVLTPYKEQKKTIEQELTSVFGEMRTWEHAIEVASVDSFQGKEKDIVIYSCVRSGGKGLGFVKDLRRLNVALTRARHALYLIGNQQSLRQSETWAALIDDAEARGLSRSVTLEEAMGASPRELLMRAVPTCLLDGSPVGGEGRAPVMRSVQLHRAMA